MNTRSPPTYGEVVKRFGLRSLDDHEIVMSGDLIKDSELGQLNVVSEDTYHGIAIGVPAGEVRTWNSVADVVRKAGRCD